MNLQLPRRISSADLVLFDIKEELVIRQAWIHKSSLTLSLSCAPVRRYAGDRNEVGATEV
jgi:hypothetical protein